MPTRNTHALHNLAKDTGMIGGGQGGRGDLEKGVTLMLLHAGITRMATANMVQNAGSATPQPQKIAIRIKTHGGEGEPKGAEEGAEAIPPTIIPI
jgi:hypothetical protein